MTVKDLERLYDYGYWASAVLFRVVSQLTPEQFTQTVTGSLAARSAARETGNQSRGSAGISRGGAP
jgi:hypothetical protein